MLLGYQKQKGKFTEFHSPRISTLLVGKPGTGKTQTLIRLALDDIAAGFPIVFIGSIDEILNHIPLSRRDDVLVFDPATKRFPFNILANVADPSLFTSVMLETVRSIWPSDISTTRIDSYIGAGLQTLLDVPDSNLFTLLDLLSDKDFRESIPIKDKSLKKFWYRYETMTPKEQRDKTESTISRIQSFMFDRHVRDCLSFKDNKMSFKDKIVLVSLSESQLGFLNVRLLGSLVIGMLALHGVGGLQTTLYVDQADRFPAVGVVLSRCPSIPVLLSVQSLSQLRDTVPIRQTLAFRTTVEDADLLEPEFGLRRDNTAIQLPLLPDHLAYVLEGQRAVRLSMPLHDYQPTHQAEQIRRRRGT